MKRKAQTLLATTALVAALMTGCRSIEVKEQRALPTGIEAGEAVTVVLNYSNELTHKQARKAEEQAYRCVKRSIEREEPLMRVIPGNEFRAAAFPQSSFDSSPRSPYSLRILARDPIFRERVAAIGLRYIVVVAGDTTTRHKWGDIECAGGFGGGGCLGIRVGEKTSTFGAVVIDLKQSGQAGEVTAKVSGHPWFAMLAILPVGVPVFTEGRACRELGDSVADFVRGGKKP